MNDTTAQSGGLAFNTPEECEAWLATQPLTSTVQMQSILQRQLGLLNRTEMRAAVRIGILEALRDQLYRTQEECQTRFARRPVPLAIPEQAAYDASLSTWQAFSAGYVRCLESLLGGEVGVNTKAAMIVERIMVTLVDMQADMYRASQLPPSTHWRNLHQCLMAGEELGVVDAEVRDKLRNENTTMSVMSLYIEAMLLHIASPTETSARQMGWLARWARTWSKKVVPIKDVPPDVKSAPLYVALDKDDAASHSKPSTSNNLRIFDTTEVRRSLKKRLVLLSKGEDPASLQLGDDCVMPATGVLLEKTYQRWCKNINQLRKHERRHSKGECYVLCGFEHVQGLFQTKADVSVADDALDMDRLRRERESNRALGEQVEAAPKAVVAAPQIAGEAWQILDQSATGLRLIRAQTRGQQRIAIGVLTAIRFKGEGEQHILASVRWTMVREDGSIEIGVHILPGIPKVIMVSGVLKGGKRTAKGKAFLLPAVAALKENSTLVIPNGWFEPGRIVEMAHEEKQTIRLGQPLERGKDFDRVTFSETVAAAA